MDLYKIYLFYVIICLNFEKGDEIMNENKGKIIQWYPGHMAKTKKQIAEIISMVDVVIEVIDSRIPYSSRIPDLKKLTRDKQNIIGKIL